MMRDLAPCTKLLLGKQWFHLWKNGAPYRTQAVQPHTRRIELSGEGTQYFVGCNRILEGIQLAHEHVTEFQLPHKKMQAMVEGD